MREIPLQEWGRRLLEDQIDRLGELRNANPRDAGFKLWRQTTLTVIQRVWPGNLSKSERFRRIPFTPTSPKANRNQVREYFERGCSEAIGYLKGLIAEIDAGGVDPARGAPITAAPEDAPGGRPALEVAPGKVLALDAAEPPVLEPGELADEQAPLGPPVRFTSPTFDHEPDDVLALPPPKFTTPTYEIHAENLPGGGLPPETPEPGERRGSTPRVADQDRPAGPAAARREPGSPPARAGRGSKRGDKRLLKEMLGFVDEPASPRPAGLRPEDAFAPPRPGATFAPPARDLAPASPPLAPSPRAEEEPPAPSFAASGGAEDPDAPSHARTFHAHTFEDDDDPFAHDDESAMLEPGEPAASAPSELAMGADVPEDDSGEEGEDEDPDFFRSSPVFAAQPRPLSAPRHTGSRTAAGSALVALAGEVANLGVPEGQRAAARAALIDLGRQFDERSAGWDSVREAIAMVLDYPPLARHVIPLLVPYLDLE